MRFLYCVVTRRIHHFHGAVISATTIRGDGGRDYLNKSSEEELTTEAVPPQPLPPTTEGAVGYPVPTSPKPPREDSCALPQHPPQANPGVYRFGAQKDSRLELEKMRGRYRRQFDFALDFKSDAPDGIIFYISDNFTHSQYVAVFLQNGRVRHRIVCERRDSRVRVSGCLYIQ